MKLTMRATSRRLKSAKEKGFVICQLDETLGWGVIVPLDYHRGPTFEVHRGDGDYDNRSKLFITGEGYCFQKKGDAVRFGGQNYIESKSRSVGFEFVF